MHEHGGGSVAELLRKRCRVSSATAKPRAGTVSPHTTVRRKHAGHRSVSDYDDLVEPRGERSQLRHSRSEHGVVGVDLLRDEDELSVAHRKSRSPSSKCGATSFCPPTLFASTVKRRVVGKNPAAA